MDERCGVWAVHYGPSRCCRIWVLVFAMYFLFYSSSEGKRQESMDMSSWCHQANKIGTLVQSRARGTEHGWCSWLFPNNRELAIVKCALRARAYMEKERRGCWEAHLWLTKGDAAHLMLVLPIWYWWVGSSYTKEARPLRPVLVASSIGIGVMHDMACSTPAAGRVARRWALQRRRGDMGQDGAPHQAWLYRAGRGQGAMLLNDGVDRRMACAIAKVARGPGTKRWGCGAVRESGVPGRSWCRPCRWGHSAGDRGRCRLAWLAAQLIFAFLLWGLSRSRMELITTFFSFHLNPIQYFFSF